ncbi:hypothetical protein BKA61DRAFT_223359 [Leptodontidium sp. MPI-SDFR-AT-0119]|nr:hypothetical protein BKA61DRAFT_223359 [Leptodontidium sp. MPI-SDFR-AT-0119]
MGKCGYTLLSCMECLVFQAVVLIQSFGKAHATCRFCMLSRLASERAKGYKQHAQVFLRIMTLKCGPPAVKPRQWLTKGRATDVAEGHCGEAGLAGATLWMLMEACSRDPGEACA